LDGNFWVTQRRKQKAILMVQCQSVEGSLDQGDRLLRSSTTTPSVASILARPLHREFTPFFELTCAFARLGTYRRDSERRERGEPVRDFRLDHEMGGRA